MTNIVLESQALLQEEKRKKKTLALKNPPSRKKSKKCNCSVSLSELVNNERLCISFTGFAPELLSTFLAQFDSIFQPESSFTAGRRSTQTAEIRGIFLLNYFRNAPSMRSSGLLFGLSCSTLEKILRDVVPRLLPVISDISFANSRASMTVPFENFPNCFVAIDCTFVNHPPPPSLSFEEAKGYFSVKHGSYGYKWLAAVNSSGQLLFLSKMFPAGVNDFAVCTDNSVLPKLRELCGNNYVLADKGFIGLQNYMNSIIPTKKSKNRRLSIGEVENNLKIAKSRILVENFFGRMKVVWTLFAGCGKIHVQNFSERFQLAAHLTNVHIFKKPLRKKSKEVAAADDDTIPDEYQQEAVEDSSEE